MKRALLMTVVLLVLLPGIAKAQWKIGRAHV